MAEEDRRYQFQIHRFWTNYKPDPIDPARLISVDMVAYGPIGGADKTVVPATVSSLLDRLQDVGNSQNNLAVAMAHARASWLRPRYEAWKKGQEMPESGTPLAAWTGVTIEEATILRSAGFRTVEDVAVMTEAHITTIKLPGLRDKKKQAQHFLDAADQNRVSVKLAQKDEEIAALKADMADQMSSMKAQMNELTSMLAAKLDADEETAEASDTVPAPKRRGRPPKAEAA